MANNSTLKEMVGWLREDLKAFEEKHDQVHSCLDKKLDMLIGFRTRVVAWGTLLGLLAGLVVKVVF